ncbi:MAG: hypothetical protein HPY59_16300 [Anaerolineae bacterium]|nr:hypothetical protein [Anaerolineae bacterium]
MMIKFKMVAPVYALLLQVVTIKNRLNGGSTLSGRKDLNLRPLAPHEVKVILRL